jgi:hypothetical protein
LKFNLEKLVGWKGGLFVVSGIDRAGEDLTSKYVGSIYSVQQMVGGQRPFLYQVFLEQKLADKKVTLKLGRFSASDDFNASLFYGYSLNNGINGDIRNVLFDTRFSAYPFPVSAAAVFYYPSPEFNVKLRAVSDIEGHVRQHRARAGLEHPRRGRLHRDRAIRLDAAVLQTTGYVRRKRRERDSCVERNAGPLPHWGYFLAVGFLPAFQWRL